MRVITTSGTRQVRFVLRENSDVLATYKVSLINENTREINVINATNTLDSKGRLLVDINYEYKEGDELALKITNDDETVIYHRNKIYVTDEQ